MGDTTIPFEVRDRWSGEIKFTAQIACSPDERPSVKLGLAVRRAVKNGANLAGADLAGAYLIRADLARANLAGANLAGVGLAGANLAGANLAGADLARANLAGAYLAGAYLAEANLARANLARANLAGVDLAGANLAGADLAGADLARANLAGAYLAGANLAGAYLLGMGDRRFVKTLQIDTWAIAYTADTMQIGCQRHPIAAWWEFTDAEIAAMDPMALDWWRVWKPVLRKIIEASPAEPTGYVATPQSGPSPGGAGG